jgi:hypothetical protein
MNATGSCERLVDRAPASWHSCGCYCTAPVRGSAVFDWSMSGVALSSRIQEAPPLGTEAEQHKRRATFRQLGDRGVLRGVCLYRCGVAEEARTRGFAPPAFAGLALVQVCDATLGPCTRAVKQLTDGDRAHRTRHSGGSSGRLGVLGDVLQVVARTGPTHHLDARLPIEHDTAPSDSEASGRQRCLGCPAVGRRVIDARRDA